MPDPDPHFMLWTVGHSSRSIDELLALLAEAAIELLIDIRTLPRSKRHPQFDRDALEAALGRAGVGYLLERRLGGLRQPHPNSIHTALQQPGLRGYADYMETDAFARNVERLCELAAERRTVVLCAEASPWHCHRSLLADALLVRGVEVRHLLGPGSVEVHRLSAHARREAGRLTYRGLL